MAGRWKKLTFVAFVFLSIASGWMMEETEGKICFKQSPSFKGKCTSNDECVKACDIDMWYNGVCSNGLCICTVIC
ncbi:defensin-like protein 3 [Cucumis melo var. makuwa]|uniref:Defensin-like protein 3 n=2 Tax=Cucumis melo TaxID=3656 RepID=A0A5D3BCI9_CUCMM|nr:defensin-like protein 3 [Cucumis melo var. makuwa]TYJ96759.1 defensin-like protein 3 [Cucumis melo var. makuwa]